MAFRGPIGSVGRGLLAVAFLALPAAGALAGTEVTLRTSNDLGLLLPGKDDLYTASLGVEVATGSLRFCLDELMFTDREAGLRFDETYLTVSKALPPLSGWNARVQAGAVRVGNGLFGQEFQNFVHRILNIDELELDYIDGNDTHALLRVEVERPFAVTATWEIGPWVDLSEAFGFKGHAILGAAARWQGAGRFSAFGRAAARYSDTELAVLDPWVDGWAPMLEAGLGYGKFLTASYSFNAFGAEEHHLHLRFRWSFD